MATERLSMRQTREILRQKWSLGRTHRGAEPGVAGHILLAAVHPSTRHALTGMLDGRVDREWAATHHPRWGPQ